MRSGQILVPHFQESHKIHIRCPSENKEAYNCRKRFYAWNLQVKQVFGNYYRSKCRRLTLQINNI